MVRVAALENYAKIINGIFGESFFRPTRKCGTTNPVIGALISSQYVTFTNNFIARLCRLHNVYCENASLPRLIDIVNRIGMSRNWHGAFAELATLDFFNFPIRNHASCVYLPVEIDVKLRKTELLGRSSGNLGEGVRIDGKFPDIDVYYDTKILKDNVTDILHSIYQQVRNKFAGDRIMIVHEFEPDSDWSDLSGNVKEIKRELVDAIQAQPGIKSVTSRIVKGLKHRLVWGGGTSVTGSVYSSYRHAQEFYYNIFKDCHQFRIGRPFFLVYVLFPWYNGIITDFGSKNSEFYRAVSRRAFCGHTKDKTAIAVFLESKHCGDSLPHVTVSQASKNLSGIVFLEDKSITAVDTNKSNVSAFIYANPNAYQKLTKTLFHDFAVCDLQVPIDDFEYDNY